MSSPNPNNDWLRSLSDTLWQIRMVSQETGGIFNSVVDTGLKLIQKIQALTGAITALTVINSRLVSGELQRSMANPMLSGSIRARRWADHLQDFSLRTRTGAGLGNRLLGRAAGVGARALQGTANLLTGGATRIIGATAGGLLAAGGGTLLAWKGLQTAYKAWSERHQENLDRARKQSVAASGVETRAAILQSKLRTDLEKQAIRDIYAIEQKRAENAKALHMMKATNVASELRYQREIFAIEERRFENEKKINRLKMAVQQHEQKVQHLIGEQERIGEARSNATIKRTWWRPDETVDANGNVISNSLAKAAGLRTFRAKSTVDANFATLQEIAKNVRNTLISSFKEGADLFATRVSSVFDKAASLGVDAMSPELEKKLDDFKIRTDSFEARWVANMDKINYDKLMRGEFKPQYNQNTGKYVFVDENGQNTAESKEKFEKRVREYSKKDHTDIWLLEKEKQDLIQEGSAINAQVEHSGQTTSVANERLKKELERRKEISEKHRESLISNTADVVGQYEDTGIAIQNRLLSRNRHLTQDYILAGVEGDAETTQRWKKQFAEENAVQDVKDRIAEKSATERRELATKEILEAGRLQIRAADRQLQASLAFKESQADLAHKINMLQLDVELANADTYGKTVWETQKTISHANIGWRHNETLRNINEAFIQREKEETETLDKEKTKGMKEFDDGQVAKREKLEKDLADAQLKYRMAEIDYEYAYRMKMEEEYERNRVAKRNAWLQGVTKEEVKALIGVDKEVSELTIDEQEKLAQTRKSNAEMAGDLASIQKATKTEGLSEDKIIDTLQKRLSKNEDLKDITYESEREKAAEELLNEGSFNDALENLKEIYESSGQYISDEDALEEIKQRIYTGELGKEKVRERIKKNLSDRGDYVAVDDESDELKINSDQYEKDKEYLKMLRWQTEHADDITQARNYEATANANLYQTRQDAEAFARQQSHLNQAIAERENVYMNVEKEKAGLTAKREEKEAEYDRRGKEEEGQRKLDKEKALHDEEYRNAETLGYNDILLSHAAKYDKFAAQQADIYNRGQIAQRNLATDNLVTAMQQNGGGYTNQMIKYGIQSEYESAKNEMEARHAAEKEQLESRGNVTEYERQELQNRQAMEASDLDNNKKLRDMMADRVMNANVGQKSGLAETWERIQASAFGHMKDPVEMAIDSLKENDSKNHDDLMSRLDQYLPAIAQNTAETDAAAVIQHNNYMSQPNANPGLVSGMPNIRMA